MNRQGRQRVLLALSLGLLVVTAGSCMLRLAWLWDSPGRLPSQWHHSGLILHEGRLLIERTTSSAVVTNQVIFNRQVAPGINLGFEHKRIGGFSLLALPIAPITLASALVLLGLATRRARHQPGACRFCGYSRHGLTAAECPECGRLLPPVSDASTSPTTSRARQ